MDNQQITMTELIIETHAGLERQGPGSSEMTVKALSFLDKPDKISRAADLGCGTGGQTLVLAQNITGSVTGVDLFPDFVDILNKNAEKMNLQDRVQGITGSIDALPFQKEELDLIWSEGAIDNIGFEQGIKYWNGFLKQDGYIVVTCPSWLTEEHPAEVEKFWSEAGSSLDTVGDNVKIMQKAGYAPVAVFSLPETCWTDNYFIPRKAAGEALLEKYKGNKMVADSVASDSYEAELFAKYKQHYGYVFYIGKKFKNLGE